MAALPDLITVAQFLEMPEGGEYCYELHYGEVVALTRPKARHWKLQSHLRRLLEPMLRSFGVVEIEAPYRPLAEFALRAADVAAISRKRFDEIDPDDALRGAPELVIEVRSPSNRKGGLQELATLCLANGSLQFWIVDEIKKSVTVVRRDGTTSLFRIGDELPLSDFGAGVLPVSEIFR